MASINEKLNYISETKFLIKNGLNDLGAEITDNDTFRSYIDKIESIYYRWPKMIVNGTEITLNNTENGKMKLLLNGNMYQEGDAAPENPKDIHVVKGHNIITIFSADGTVFQTLPLDLPEGIEMCRISDYADTFKNVDKKWYKNKIINKITLIGTEDWNNTFGISLFSLQNYLTSKKFIVGYGICNYYKYNSIQSGLNANLLNGQFALQRANNIYNIFLKNTDYDNINDFKDWLSTHNTDIYYPLQTPILEEITDPTLISQLDAIYESVYSYNDTTIITQENEDLPFTITATALLKNS